MSTNDIVNDQQARQQASDGKKNKRVVKQRSYPGISIDPNIINNGPLYPEHEDEQLFVREKVSTVSAKDSEPEDHRAHFLSAFLAGLKRLTEEEKAKNAKRFTEAGRRNKQVGSAIRSSARGSQGEYRYVGRGPDEVE